MSAPKPRWHAEAQRLRRKGFRGSTIAKMLGKSESTVYRLFNPAYKAKRVEQQRKWVAKQLATDPDYAVIRRQKQAARRERLRTDPARAEQYQRELERNRARGKLNRIRADARKEAAARRVPVEVIYAKWGVNSAKPV